MITPTRKYRVPDLDQRPGVRRYLARLTPLLGPPESWGSFSTIFGETWGYAWHGNPRGSIYVSANYTLSKHGVTSLLLFVRRSKPS